VVQFRFESIFPVVVLSLVLVGMPAVILKQAAIWFVRMADGARLRLLGLSIAADAAVGTAAILLYVWLSSRYEANAYPLFHSIPAIEAGTAVALLGLVAGADGWLWSRFQNTHGPQPLRATLFWLIGGNAWIPWALLLMHLARQNSGFVD
jgi:hypothetical protein